MYAIVRKVVTPALISPSTVLPAAVTPNLLSNASIFSPFFPLYHSLRLGISMHDEFGLSMVRVHFWANLGELQSDWGVSGPSFPLQVECLGLLCSHHRREK